MLRSHSNEEKYLPPFLRHSSRPLGKRVRDMMLVWLLFGIVLGLCSEPARGGTFIGVLSGVIAGLVVMLPLGVLLGLFGGEVKPTVLGGIAAATLGACIAAGCAMPNPHFILSLSLILGGLLGATFSVFLWWVGFVTRALMALPGRR